MEEAGVQSFVALIVVAQAVFVFAVVDAIFSAIIVIMSFESGYTSTSEVV